nr:MAG TPA: 6-pyruvoyl tetrahydropterin synthase [Caudoviricetes sp.]
MVLNKEFKFDAAHLLPNHKGQCKNLHGHTYKLIISCAGEKITTGTSKDMIIDFGDLKKIVEEIIISKFDHSFMYSDDSEVENDIVKILKKYGLKVINIGCRTTAENIAAYIYNNLKKELMQTNIRLTKVTLFETETSFVEYGE